MRPTCDGWRAQASNPGTSAYGGETPLPVTAMVDYYAYDFGSRLTSLHATGNGTDAAAYYQYDANCTVKVVNNGLVVSYYTYDPANRIVRLDREAGLHLYYAYDNANATLRSSLAM